MWGTSRSIAYPRCISAMTRKMWIASSGYLLISLHLSDMHWSLINFTVECDDLHARYPTPKPQKLKLHRPLKCH